MSRPVGALLTGATGGLGPAVARALSDRDVTLALAGRREDAVAVLASELSASGVIKAIQTDAPEVLVYPGPIRPLLAFGALAPRLSERLNRRLGLATLFKPAADARGHA